MRVHDSALNAPPRPGPRKRTPNFPMSMEICAIDAIAIVHSAPAEGHERPIPFLCLVQTKGELAYPVHQMALETTFRDQGSELSSDPMIPQMAVVADLTRSADELSLKPGDAVGDCHARRPRSVREAPVPS